MVLEKYHVNCMVSYFIIMIRILYEIVFVFN